MKRVIVTGAANIGSAGVATMVYRWGQNFDSKKIIYDYLLPSKIPEEKYIEKIKSVGGKIISPLQPLDSKVKQIEWMIRAIKDGNYSDIHINIDTAYMASLYIWIARKAGVKRILVHSHCAQIDESNKLKRGIKILLHKTFRHYVINHSELYLACSKEASKWMYGDSCDSSKVRIIYTGEDVDEFQYYYSERTAFKKDFGLENSFIIGSIGRFSYQKNHLFMLEVFEELLKRKENAILLLVGRGPLKTQIVEKVREKGLENKVIFLQDRDDIPVIYSSMDVFVMTSLFEGMPATAIEAQMSFLPCVISDCVTHDLKFIDEVTFITGWDVHEWVDNILRFEGINRMRDREMIVNSPFNLVNTTKYLQDILENTVGM